MNARSVTVISHVAPPIQIESSQESEAVQTERALAKIMSKPIGRRLINEIQSAATDGRMIRIQTSNKQQCEAGPFLTRSQCQRFELMGGTEESNRKAAQISHYTYTGKAGEPVAALIRWNPETACLIDKEGYPVLNNNPNESFISLAHELVHAHGFMTGQHYYDFSPLTQGTMAYKEEERAIGIGGHDKEKLSENAIRLEHEMASRKHFFTRSQ
ncbi:hypothetical protein F3J37_01640 [Pantoea sp. Al-1710]|uniref:Uncharacterized protein n=1 Tax=Candidatus Pantoea communis TaxID=2608354 RepID=A0ABX0RL84_9GAMM|nr:MULTISPECIES: M91 family zinc metallopeptidase [Pantoea]NIG12918.1 hypothetical protein [Pantoea sp. Cy-640]NIG17381.1 hypothetical protein [Pantoea communis]